MSNTLYPILGLLNIYILVYGFAFKLWWDSKTTEYVAIAVGVLFFATPYVDRLYLDIGVEAGVIYLFIRAIKRKYEHVVQKREENVVA